MYLLVDVLSSSAQVTRSFSGKYVNPKFDNVVESLDIFISPKPDISVIVSSN